MRAGGFGRLVPAVLGLLLCAVWGVVHLKGLTVVPPAGGDETSLLNMPYRLIHAGDWRYPLIYSDTFNAGAVRAYPPLLAFAPLAGLQWLFGFSGAGARVISALSMLGIAALIALLVWRHARSAGLALAMVALLAVSPTFFLMSRSVRFEQIILLCGVASVALPFLVLPPRPSPAPLRGALVWCASALLAALAAGAHPMALGFGAPLAVHCLAGHRYWAPRDGLGPLARVLAAVAGGLPLVIVSVVPLMWVEGGYGAYLAEIDSFVSQRSQTFVGIFNGQAPAWLKGLGFPPVVNARILELSHTTFMLNYAHLASAVPALLAPFALGGWVVLAAMRQGRGLFRAEAIPVWAGLAALAGLTLAKLVYSINMIYGGYIAVGCLLALALAPEPMVRARLWRWPVIAVLVLASASAAVTVQPHAEKVLSLPAGPSRTLDETYALLREEGAAAFAPLRGGPTRGAAPRIYTDTLAWMAAFPDEHSILDVVSGGHRFTADGLALNIPALDFFLNYLPAPEGTEARMPKARRVLAVLAPLSLAGVLHDGVTGNETQLFRAAAGAALPLRLRLIDAAGRDRLVRTGAGIDLAVTGGEVVLPAEAAGRCSVVVFLPAQPDAERPRLAEPQPGEAMVPVGLAMKTAAARVFAVAMPAGRQARIIAPDIARVTMHPLEPGASPCSGPGGG